jgi:glycosyltransferase involved in cell wall biosynthesis
MTISVITPTADQPTGIRLLESYMARQTIQPDQWIVADDGKEPATLTMGQTHIITPRKNEGGRSLATNILAGLEAATGDVIVIMEHDDWYSSNHLETCLEGLREAEATGSKFQRYYNVHFRCWIVMINIGSALCNTAFLSKHKQKMEDAARLAFIRNVYSLDRMFWDYLPMNKVNIHEINTVVGIKGLPGRAGLGLGHRPTKERPWKYDKDLSKLREWIGDDANNYIF